MASWLTTGVTMATGCARISIPKQCSHVTTHFMNTSFSDGNSGPNCNCKSRSTCILEFFSKWLKECQDTVTDFTNKKGILMQLKKVNLGVTDFSNALKVLS